MVHIEKKIEIRISAVSQSKQSFLRGSFDENYRLSYAASTKLRPTKDLKTSQIW